MSEPSSVSFQSLGLPDFVLQALQSVGYETPSPIQEKTIPLILAGRDVLGQAQTGTGKTAAFALPLVANIDPATRKPQALILAPTRELAIQVAEAIQKYASRRPGLHVLPIYGGQNYTTQLRGLQRGAHVVVGTPGRIMDHMRKGALDLSELKTLVLDEADEMLRMGFIDDVEWILEKTPGTQQTALFSATMPREIKVITKRYLKNPEVVTIEVKTQTASTIRQRVWMVSGLHKLDALTRILETEPFDGSLIFVRTKIATEELADKLKARGYAAAALNGDMQQKARAQTVEQLKNGRIDIVIATDVAARGLDVERISHVINYDIPYDTEAYVHRIGRTGRAGRSGEAILFAAPREQRMLRSIERATKQPIEPMRLPSVNDVNDRRIERFKDRILETLQGGEDLSIFRDVVEQIQMNHNIPVEEIAVALAKICQGDTPLLLQESSRPERKQRSQNERSPKERSSDFSDTPKKGSAKKREKSVKTELEGVELEMFRVAAGADQGVSPKHVVGAIANEAGIDSQYIGSIEILKDATLVQLPSGMPKEVFQHLKKARLLGHPMRIARVERQGSSWVEKAETVKKTSKNKPPKSKPKKKRVQQ